MHQRTGRVHRFEARGGREDVGDEPIGRPTSAAARRAAVGVRDDRLEPRRSGLTVALGIAARSLALIGFGADSVIEVFASSVVVWHIRPGHEEDRPERTRLALRLVAGAFLALGVVLIAASLHDLITGRKAGASPIGIAYLAVIACVMFGLAFRKRRVATGLASAAGFPVSPAFYARPA